MLLGDNVGHSSELRSRSQSSHICNGIQINSIGAVDAGRNVLVRARRKDKDVADYGEEDAGEEDAGEDDASEEDADEEDIGEEDGGETYPVQFIRRLGACCMFMAKHWLMQWSGLRPCPGILRSICALHLACKFTLTPPACLQMMKKQATKT